MVVVIVAEDVNAAVLHDVAAAADIIAGIIADLDVEEEALHKK